MIAIETRNLTKKYKNLKVNTRLLDSLKKLVSGTYQEQVALDEVSISILEGEIVGIVGADRAGKSTLLKILGGRLKASSGETLVFGKEPTENVVGTTNQSIILVEKNYDVSKEKMLRKLEECLRNKPKLLLLDEPVASYDAVARKEILEQLGKVNETVGTTIILTSNSIGGMELLCHRFIVLSGGKVIYNGNWEDLYQGYMERKKVSFTFEKPVDIAFLDEELEVLENTPCRKTVLVAKEKVDDLVKSLKHLVPSRVVIEEESIEKIVECISNKKMFN